MNEVQSHNNNGLFRTRKSYKDKKRYGRLFIRRSKIYHSLTNNSLSQTVQLKHRRINRKRFNDGGGGDEKMFPSLSNERKHIDFTELEHIFDNAIRNRVPLELYKEKSPTKQQDYLPVQSIPKLTNNRTDARIELSNQSFLQPIKDNSYYFMKYRKILLAITLVTLSAAIGFVTVFLFFK
ncbi:unnamed protein product [Adineta steineri]|uniref:Uncharacterized protein n=2 Tax=Adineta steineri TaxID=433720 RepID=A0A814CSZ9_9BILA|nr:unnamed protein product [Adineta steineri]